MAHVGSRKFVHVPAPTPWSWISQVLLRAFGRPPRPEPPPIQTLVEKLDEDESRGA